MDQERNRCLECGAPLVDGLNCWGQLGAIRAWEFQDPALLAEHFLIIASYNLQHPAQFTDEGITWLQATLIEYLDRGIPAIELRRQAARQYNGPKRVLKNEADRQPVLRRWQITIADVYLPDQPEGAADRVRAWAVSIRQEL